MDLFSHESGRRKGCIPSGPTASLAEWYSSSRNQLAPRTLLVCFPDPTMNHASPYIVTLYTIPVLMILYSFVKLQGLLYITSMSNTTFSRRFCANWEDNLAQAIWKSAKISASSLHLWRLSAVQTADIDIQRQHVKRRHTNNLGKQGA